MPAVMTEMFAANVRYTGLSVSYNVSLALFGGTAPVFSTWLIKISGGNVWMPAYYLILTSIIALITVFFIPETYKKKLD
jgi:MHS family proline/betaine transporter-like MFS transporter